MSAAEQMDTLQQWQERLQRLFDDVREWIEPFEWSSKLISKSLEDSDFGRYSAPALLIQKETTRMLFDPIWIDPREGSCVVDLYILPAYDDVARLSFTRNESWRVDYVFSPRAVDGSSIIEEAAPLTKELFIKIAEEMVRNAANPV